MTASPPPATPEVSSAGGIGPLGIGTIASAAILLSLLLFGMAQEQVWLLFSKPVTFRTNDANGLAPGLPIRLSGYPIGRIDRVELRRDTLVEVTLRIQPSYRPMLGSRSIVHLDQEGLVGSSFLAITADPTGSADQERPLMVSYTPPVDVKDLLVGLAQSRIPLNRLLNHTAKLAETALPRTLREVDRTVHAAGTLSRALQRQSQLTASQARHTLQTYEELGQDGRHDLSASRQELETLLPLVRGTLLEIRRTAQTSQTLLDRLSRSWLMPLLDASTPAVTAPVGPSRP
ncbi:MAG: MlaD family protein [Cyanobacteriota bacterium]